MEASVVMILTFVNKTPWKLLILKHAGKETQPRTFFFLN